jgi:hypothetical protein
MLKHVCNNTWCDLQRVRHNFAAPRERDPFREVLIGGRIMASWGFFFIGLFVGQATLVFFLALIRQGSAVETVKSPPLAAEHEAPVSRQSIPVEATWDRQARTHLRQFYQSRELAGCGAQSARLKLDAKWNRAQRNREQAERVIAAIAALPRKVRFWSTSMFIDRGAPQIGNNDLQGWYLDQQGGALWGK